MRVLLTCHVRFASAMAWYTFHLARGLRAQGHDVYLSAQRGSPLAGWAAEEQLPCSSEYDFHSRNPLHLLGAVRHLSLLLRTLSPDILNPHCPPGHALLALVNRGRLPLIRSVAEPRAPKSNVMNRVLHERRTQGMIYSTASSVERYRAVFNFPNVPQQVIHPGLDLALFPEVKPEQWRSKLDIADDVLFGAIVARMSPEKGQEIFIEALALLDSELRRKIVVLLTGDDNRQRSWQDLQAFAVRKGVESSLRFTPRLTDVRPLLSEIDFGIITSLRSEAVCRIALEYMAYSKPVLSSDVNILPEVVRTDLNGWVYPHRDPARLADLLRRAIEERARLRDFGMQGRRLLESEFTLENMTSQTIKFYRQVIAGYGHG